MIKTTHGGHLQSACVQYGGTPSDWLDLSTGIAPWSYPLPAVPESVWQRLPELSDGLEAIASRYYAVDEAELLAISGSQWAIEQIPLLYPAGLRVGMLNHGYFEHAFAWQAAGHFLRLFATMEALLLNASSLDAVVLISPHNPLGFLVSEQEARQLKKDLNLGVMVIDLAFADANPIPDFKIEKDTWLLRSVGKFFGLAGIRLGFVLSTSQQIEMLKQQQSPWAVNHLARWAGKFALADSQWQKLQSQRLQEQSQRLRALLENYNLGVMASSDYFITITHPQAEAIIQSALTHHILLRHFPAFNGIRFGLPKTEGDWLRLEKWLAVVAAL
jgi:cobalamin biosynthetic protein CobC